ncbi:MAG: deoxyhypusine synthase, partial [Chloroflexi bacterium]|nr:deoxyhypusine synthase [Chloroflexota bacterium]
ASKFPQKAKASMDDFFNIPVTPFAVSPQSSASQLLAKMGKTSFQARNLALGAEIWSQMLQHPVTIFLGLAGAMIPAGMRQVMAYLIQNRLIDCLVSTGANLFHDLHETLGQRHWQGSPHMDDRLLGEAKINRIYDTLALEKEFAAADEFITQFSSTLDSGRAYTTREYFYLLGQQLTTLSKEEGILTTAAKAQIPVYCPAVADSVFGMAVAAGRVKNSNHLLFDVIQDVVEITQIALVAPATGVVYIGGGTPKNFIQQAEITAFIFDKELEGHQYAIQITTDSPQWGGLSGCSLEEGQSWRKIAPQAHKVTINCDATIALPLLVSALAERGKELIGGRPRPHFTLGQELEIG